MIEIKAVSSLEKPFLDQRVYDFKAVDRLVMLRDQHLSFQVIYRENDPLALHRNWMRPVVEGELCDYVTLRTVECVPSVMPVYPDKYDDNFLRTEPGLYPDLLKPLSVEGHIPVIKGQLRSLWVDVDTCGIVGAGEYPITVAIESPEGRLAEVTLTVKILNSYLPEQTFKVTQWFHCDCLADYYGVGIFSEEHWKIIESFLATAVKNGINTILTPVFTPPLDTHVGGERPTVQLVGVTRETVDGKFVYSFDYTLFDRWVALCDDLGVKNFEISHLFTQWGAAHAPKICATVKENGESRYERIFGWDTEVTGMDCEYAAFIRAFLTDFTSYIERCGIGCRCIFHISDEPNEKCIEQYTLSKSIVCDLLEGYTCMDALSHVKYYEEGIISVPVAANNKIDNFIKAGVPRLWAYYCCGQSVDVSNRFMAMPGARTRIMGTQCFKYGIEGFLQWGYNFYYNQGSYDKVNPFLDTTGEYFSPSGDAFSVYPGADGKPLESIRLLQFREGLEDMRAMEHCASVFGREAVLAAIEERYGEITFGRCPRSSEEMMGIRGIVDRLVEMTEEY